MYVDTKRADTTGDRAMLWDGGTATIPLPGSNVLLSMALDQSPWPVLPWRDR